MGTFFNCLSEIRILIYLFFNDHRVLVFNLLYTSLQKKNAPQNF